MRGKDKGTVNRGTVNRGTTVVLQLVVAHLGPSEFDRPRAFSETVCYL